MIGHLDDDIDALMAQDLDGKADAEWERGVREQIGDAEFERLYPHDCGEDTCVCDL